MNAAFPAAPRALLLSYEEPDMNFPILGWSALGHDLMPLVLGHPGPLVTGEAVYLELDGYISVVDLASGRMFNDVDSWRANLDEDTMFRAGGVIHRFAPPRLAPEITPAVVVNNTPVNRVAPAEKLPIEPEVGLVWGTKTFKSKSFWFYGPAGKDPIIFVVEGNDVTPKNAEKITREDFYAKRKLGVNEVAGKPGDEPELPLSGDADAGAEEDVDDLV